MRELLNQTRAYLVYVERHFDNVQKAWDLLREKGKGNPDLNFLTDDYLYHQLDNRVKKHDLSKLSAQEFTQYRNHFYPTREESVDTTAFEAAWDHHKANNSHHWQNWTQRLDKYKPDRELDIVEMVLDWVAMGMEFGDTAAEYYERNKASIIIPKWAEDFMYTLFVVIYSPEKTEL